MPDSSPSPAAAKVHHDGPEQLEPQRLVAIFLAVSAVLFLASLGQTVVTTALPVILADLGGMDQITWVITAYLMAATVGAPVFGKMGDLFGRKIMMQIGIGIFLTGSVLCALAPELWVLVGGRFVQGFGGGGLIVSSMATVADNVSPRERGRYQGILGSVFGLSTVVGPLAGGFIVQHFDWQWIFLINVPLGLAALTVLTLAIRHSPRRPNVTIDYAGAAGLIVLLSLTVMTASLGGSVLEWSDPLMIGLIAAALVALVVFVTIERRARDAILPLELFRINNFVVSNSVGMIVGVTMFGTITFVPFFMQVVKGMTPAASGLFVFPMMAGLIGASTLAGQVMARTGRYRLLPILSTMILVVGLVSMAMTDAHTPNWRVAVTMLVVGLGIGPTMGVGVTAIQNAVPRHMIGIGTASANMFRLIGGSVGTAAFGAIFAAGLQRHLGGALEGANPRGLTKDMIAAMDPAMQEVVTAGIAAALHPVFWIACVMACVACAISFMMVELPLQDRAPSAPAPKPSTPQAQPAE
ncbi:MAG: EmrB/QacA family drug resistance transporter [Rhodobacteraceae bacterium]|nr:EmrB/QacA family drug resistance transporter [Paracoccaceae bacterium]MAY43871.1 EmrB/QacA family drug resistance transporter [Paracoccaceae bacterium]QEW21809.1 Multidrug-efflux transporter 3 [Marinibacterium anthonyi]